MGQGYSLTSISAGSAALDASELSDLIYEKSLGNARFMKTIRARRDDGVVVAKLAMKPVQNQNWDQYVKSLNAERAQLADIPNALGYHRIQQTSTTGILMRQFIHSSLYDRISTRPFLDIVEKRWLAYQLLCAVRDAHSKDIFHGDIKTENVLVTSWNWLYLTDFSSCYKPSYLPEDNPADFSFYFDTSGRRTCYLAPERFLRSSEDATKKTGLNWSMDIFSVGCVIAELFLETPIFSLSQLLRYRANEYDPQVALEDIKDPDIREMVAHMIQLDPQARYAADEYLNFWRSKAFPEYFSSFLHQYMYLITDPTSGRRPITSGRENLGESDDRIDRVYNDFDKIAYFLAYDGGSEKRRSSQLRNSMTPNALFPLQVDIPNHRHTISPTADKPSDNGSLLFLTLVEASLRSTARSTPRIKAIELLLVFAERVPDEVKLDRILPYLMDMLGEDQTEPVRIYALRATTQLVSQSRPTILSLGANTSSSNLSELSRLRMPMYLPNTFSQTLESTS
jgi:phosphoinositide-3-kinase regulatory subunit 4